METQWYAKENKQFKEIKMHYLNEKFNKSNWKDSENLELKIQLMKHKLKLRATTDTQPRIKNFWIWDQVVWITQTKWNDKMKLNFLRKPVRHAKCQ